MRERLLGSLAALLAAAGLAAAQGVGPDTPPGPADPPSAVEAAGIRARRAHPAPPGGPGPAAPDVAPEPGEGCPVPTELPPPVPSEEGPPPPWCSLYSNMGPHCWVDADYLHWWIKTAPVPEPLLTTGNTISLVVPPGFGVLGQNGTSVLFGNNTLDQGQADGGRVSLGGWLECSQWPGCKPIGYELNWFMLGRIAGHFENHSNALGEPLLARPIIDAATNNETAFFVSLPGVFSGRFSVDTSTQLWGGEANLFVPLIGQKHILLGGILGFRYLDLEETLEINQRTNVIGNGVLFFNGSPIEAGNTVDIADDFKTHDRFYGGQIGAQASIRFGRTTLDLLGKVGLGVMHEEAHIAGGTTVTGPAVPGGTATTGGGLLAVASNSGDFGRSQFAVVPEAATTLTYQLTDNFALHVGYTFLYANEVLRPGQQIDRTVNSTLVPTSETFGQPVFNPGPARPTFEAHSTDFWAHGLSLGLTLSF